MSGYNFIRMKLYRKYLALMLQFLLIFSMTGRESM
jgi:hypothetical protein